MAKKASFRILIYVILLILPAANALGQTKYEKEEKLKLREVPAKARQFVDSLHFQSKVKWYYEQNLQGNSIEAKAKIGKKEYSIEFDTLGNIQDMEVQLEEKEVPQNTFSAIEKALQASFSSFQINKIQVQYKSDPSTLLLLAKNQSAKRMYTTSYELVVKGKKGKQVKLYEITFTENGELTATSEIIFSNTDNLEY
jgi:hypothetical protein